MPAHLIGRRAARASTATAQLERPGIAARLLEFGEELRGEGVAVGTTELLDAFAVLQQVPWTEQVDFREALAATLAKSQEDRRIFDLVFDRFFFRAAELAAVARGRRARRAAICRRAPAPSSTSRRCASRSPQALRDGDEAQMRDLARLAIAAFGRQGEGSGVIGVDVQRIRRALACAPSPSPTCRRTTRARDGLPRDAIRRFEALLRQELERRQIERTEPLPPARPLNELDRALPSGPLQDLAAVHRVVAQLKRRLKTQGHEQRGRKRHAQVDVRKTMRASLETGGVPVVSSTSRSARGAPRSTCCATSRRSVTSACVFFLSVLHALHDSFRKMRSFVFIERISEVTDVFEGARLQGGQRGDRPRRRRGRHLRLHRLRPRLERVPRARRGRPAPARDGDRARRRAHERPRPARRHLRPDRRQGRAHVLAEPRAAAVLELRRLA